MKQKYLIWERRETKQTKNKTKYEENIIRRIKNFFKLKKESEAIKVRIIRVIRTLFEKEDDYYKQTRLDNFGITIISNIKAIVIEIKIF